MQQLRESKLCFCEYREEKLEQIHLLLGFEGIDYHHDDYYSLLVFSSLLGGGISRLFQEIREKRGLVYGISAFSAAYQIREFLEFIVVLEIIKLMN